MKRAIVVLLFLFASGAAFAQEMPGNTSKKSLQDKSLAVSDKAAVKKTSKYLEIYIGCEWGDSSTNFKFYYTLFDPENPPTNPPMPASVADLQKNIDSILKETRRAHILIARFCGHDKVISDVLAELVPLLIDFRQIDIEWTLP